MNEKQLEFLNNLTDDELWVYIKTEKYHSYGASDMMTEQEMKEDCAELSRLYEYWNKRMGIRYKSKQEFEDEEFEQMFGVSLTEAEKEFSKCPV